MLIDTHAHIYSEDFDNDRDEVIIRAKTQGIKHIIMPSISQAEYPRLISCLERYLGYTSAALGLHPAYVRENYEEELQFVREQKHSQPWRAIGEVGLDYYWSTDFKQEQIIALKEQLNLALELDLPVIFHVRDAYEDITDLLRADKWQHIRGVIHSFTGKQEDLQELLKLPNLMIGINGVATFKNSKLRDYIGQIPLDRLLLETDSPYLAPVPQRGKRNEPSFVRHTAEYLAELWAIPLQEIAQRTSRNAEHLFAL